MSEKDSLVSQSEAQHNPYLAKPSDFPASSVGKAGMAEGQNQLVGQSEKQGSPRHVEDGGPGSHGAGTPSEWGKGGTQFKVSKGENPSTSLSEGCSVDLKTGQIEVSGYSRTRVGEVADPRVSIPSR